jgi:hypothetical protein
MRREAGHAAGAAVERVPPRPGGRAILGNRWIWRWAPPVAAVAVALVGAGLMFSGRTDPAAFAEVRAGQVTGQGVVVSATTLGDNEVVICLVDTSRDRMAVYVADGRRGRLKLVAVRDISADWALTDYNNEAPLPKDIRARVEKAAESASPAKGAQDRKPEVSP